MVSVGDFVKRHIECQKWIYTSEIAVLISTMSISKWAFIGEIKCIQDMAWLKYFRDTLNRGEVSSYGYGL